MAPLFIPLLDLKAETTLLASQCTLTVAGCPSPLEVALHAVQAGDGARRSRRATYSTSVTS